MKDPDVFGVGETRLVDVLAGRSDDGELVIGGISGQGEQEI